MAWSHTVWSEEKRGPSPVRNTAGGCAGAPCCSAHTQQLRQGWDVPFSSAFSGHIAPGITKCWGSHPTRSHFPPCRHCIHTLQTGCSPKPSEKVQPPVLRPVGFEKINKKFNFKKKNIRERLPCKHLEDSVLSRTKPLIVVSFLHQAPSGLHNPLQTEHLITPSMW